MNENELAPPSTRRASRIVRPAAAELPGMPPPSMPPIYVGVAFHRQRRRWRIVKTGDQEFVVSTALRNLRGSHYQHGRLYRLSEEAA